MRVFSTFSGISAATAAWRGLGWTMAGYAEINASACAVLAARCGATQPKYLADPDHDAVCDGSFALNWHLDKGRPKGTLPPRLLSYPNLGIDPAHLRPGDIMRLYDLDEKKFADMTLDERDRRERTISAHRRTKYAVTGITPNFGDIWYITDEDLEELGPIDLLEGGSPCQAFSVAGKGDGMLDHRSALLFGFLDLIERMKRINGLKWVLFENVKGVLRDSHNGFGFLLGGLAKREGVPILPAGGRYANAGYVSGADGDIAWRLLDAQHFGVPQRRERVFALARVGAGAAGIDPREILFDSGIEGWRPQSRHRKEETVVRFPERSAEALAGYRGPVVFMAGQSAKAYSVAESTTVSPTLRSGRSGSNQVPSIAYMLPDHSPDDDAAPKGRDIDPTRLIVRKLLPVECERLQGFPDGWTEVEVNGQVLSDAARQECIGNSMAVDVMRWIGRRLEAATMATVKADAG